MNETPTRQVVCAASSEHPRRAGVTAESRRAGPVISLAAAGISLALVGCGTHATGSGSVCGAPIELDFSDYKDRDDFAITIETAGAGAQTCRVTIGSTGSSTSSPIAAQAEAISKLAELLRLEVLP